MITAKPKYKIKRMLPDELPQPAELPESEESQVGDGAGFKSAAYVSAESAPPAAARKAKAPARALKGKAPARALKSKALPPPVRPSWVQQVFDYVEREVPAESRVQNIAQLHKLLRRALLIEHSTIPPYLTALYSIKDGTNIESVNIIRAVLVEEMLHMILAANVLNAVGGEPVVNEPRFIPSYPLDLTDVLQPNTDDEDSNVLKYLSERAESEDSETDGDGHTGHVRVQILKFSMEAIDTFVAIETPEPTGPGAFGPITTIGQFYTLVIHGMEKLEEEARRRGETIFTNDPAWLARQIGPEHYYGSGGGAYMVTDLDRARDALGEIICQGEGFKDICYKQSTDLGEYEELGHYFRFMQIKKGHYYAPGDHPNDDPTGPQLKVDWDAVYNMKPNPKLKDFGGDAGLEAMGRQFNQTYLLLLDQIQRAFTGEPEALQEAVAIMFDLKYTAGGLMRVPLADGQYMAGPIFGPGSRRAPLAKAKK
jgi:hypothetical protein